MATITVQLLIGEAHTWHGGIMNAATINLYENSRPAWVYEPAKRKEENIYWVPTIENMLEDGLLLAAVHIWRNEDIIGTLREAAGNDNLNQLELYNLSKEGRDIIYEKCRVLNNGAKVIQCNVALSRAKDSFLVFGDIGIFDAGSSKSSGILVRYIGTPVL